MKKILIVLLAIASVALLLFMYSGDSASQLTRETTLSGKNAVMAEKFTRFIYEYAKNNRKAKFQKRFRHIPPENIKWIWETLISIQKMGEPIKVTVPATGKTRCCVYYRKDDDSYYKFVVNNSKDQWLFQEFAVMEVND